jgi:NitT/TauT family transport system substrate-binding protein
MKIKKKRILAVIGVVIAVLGVTLVLFTKGTSGKMESIHFGTVPTSSNTLIYIAEDRGFFAANRLSVGIRDYSTGIATTEALLEGDLDIAWVAEFPFVHRAFAKERISILAVVGRFDEQVFFGLKDRGIHYVADLKGKRIGIPQNTIAEFYLGRFLELNRMSAGDVSLIDVPPQQSMEAIERGGVDGVIAWQPYSSQLRVQLADRAAAFPIQSGQPGYGTVVCRNDWISDYPGIVKRFLKSLVQAENYLIHNPASAKAIVRKRLDYSDVFTETIWSENQFPLSLDQSLIAAMEDEARWMIQHGLTNAKKVPDFLEYIYEDGLKALRPESVNIVR